MPKEGLTDSEVAILREKHGYNTIPEKEKYTWFTILIAQFNNPLTYLFLGIAAISFYFREFVDAGLIGLVTVFNVVTGFSQEYSAQRTLKALKGIIKEKTFVIRGGVQKEIDTKELVPGDLVVISSGDKIPADSEIISGKNILVNEAILTGEEEAVSKDDTTNNKVYMGTLVAYGQGVIKVLATGRNTKIGKIGQSLSEIEEADTPLQKRLKKLTRSILYFILALSAIILTLQILKGFDIWHSIQIAVVLSIAAVPEGLPIAVTVILAIGVRRILKKKGLVKKLLSIETLGSTSVICLDKTGTLTEGKMQVAKTDFTDKKTALLALTLVNDRKVALELAIWNYLEKHFGSELNIIFNSHERFADEPFDSTKKYKSVIAKVDGANTDFTMGAPEVILDFCNLTESEKQSELAKVSAWAEQGLRILGVAYKQTSKLQDKHGFTWLGLIGVKDPIRKEARAAFEEAVRAGLKVKIVTGDYRGTAIQVAKSMGLRVEDENIMEAEELNSISEEDLYAKIDNINLFTRVTPLQKLKIIKVLQEKGEIVAMTGDGVNDAPALKKANIGIVVQNATDVAKQASDLILLDSNFQTIVNTIEEGRLILMNIKKVVGYVLSNSFEEIIVITVAIFLGMPGPITVAQILWINLICDGLPDIALGFEKKTSDLMKLNPQEIKSENILSNPMKIVIGIVSTTSGLTSVLVFWYYHTIVGDTVLARTLVFSIFATLSLVYIFAFKNLKEPIINTKNLLGNRFLNLSIVYGFVLILMALYVPALNGILGTKPLNFRQWGIVLGTSVFITILIDLLKIASTKVLKKAYL